MSHPPVSLLHRRIGLAYVVAMIAMNVSSFFIFSLTGEFAVRIPDTRFWWAVAVASFSVIAAGGTVLAARLPGLRACYGSLADRRRP